MSRIVNDKKNQKHIVKSYKFKTLDDEVTEEEFISFKEVSNQPTQLEETKSSETRENEELIKSLLSKIEELSNNIIKSQLEYEERLKQINQENQQKIQEAFEAGYKKGKEEAKIECETEIIEIKKLYEDSIKKLEEVKKIFDTKIEEIEKELVAVALDIAKEVLAKELNENSKEVATNLAKALIEEIKQANDVIIKVNPKDYEFVKENIKDLKIVADEAVKEGGVVINSEAGNIDGNIEERFKRVKEAILKARND